MIGLLYFFALVIIFHNLLVLFSLLRREDSQRYGWSIFQEVAMMAAAVFAMIDGHWAVLVVGFGLYRFCLTLHAAISAWLHHRPASPVLLANLLMVVGAAVTFATQWWWLFPACYVVFWILSYILARKALHSHLPTS